MLVSATFLEAPEKPDQWLSQARMEELDLNKEAHHLIVFQVLSQASILTPQVAEPQWDAVEGWTNSHGMVMR